VTTVTISFSLIIPSAHGGAQLQQLLNSLLSQNYPSRFFEVLVVFNRASLEEVQLVQLKSKYAGLDLRVLHEPKLGPSFARNRGAGHARSTHLIFLDDDVRVRPDFLTGYATAWKKYPSARILGGRVKVTAQGHQQTTLQRYGWCFAHHQPFNHDFFMSPAETAYSANLSYRKNPDQVKVFSEELGILLADGSILGAEDYELCLRTLNQAEQAVLIADMRVQVSHQVDRSRWRQSYLLHRFWLAGKEHATLEKVLQAKFPELELPYQEKKFVTIGIRSLLTSPYEWVKLVSYWLSRLKKK